MNNRPKVSVVITNYNNEKYISDCLRSAIGQSYTNLEILVIDDCSADSSVSLIRQAAKSDARIRIITNKKNLGYLRSFNKVLNECTGDLVTFIDGDDWISPQKIEKQVRAFAADPDLGCCGTGFARTDSGGHTYEVIRYPLSDEAIRQSLASSPSVCFCGSSVMVRREVLRRIGGYREFFVGSPAEDYDWLRRIANQFKMANLPDPLYMYRFSPGSLSANVRDHEVPYFAAYIAMFLDRQRLGHGGRDGLDATTLERAFQDFLAALAVLYQGRKAEVAFKRIVGLGLRRTRSGLPLALSSLWRESPPRAVFGTVVYLMIHVIPVALILKVKRYLGHKKCNDPAVMALMDQYL